MIPLEYFNKIIWIIAISLILLNSVYYSIVLKFPQFRLLKILKSLKTKKQKGNISPLDTLIMTLSSKIGVGSLAGIAVAIAYGGLGSIFWIWISSFFLAIITYLENSLAIIYQNKTTPPESGPFYYLKKGLNSKNLSIIYSILIIITYIFLFSSIQTNTIVTLTTELFNIDKIILSLVITIAAGIIIIKGIKTISSICNKIFPLMMLLFLILGLIIIIQNIELLPTLFISIITEALNKKSLSGGIIYTIIISLQKTIFANESGAGTSAIISGTTINNNYKRQGNLGIVQTYFINFIVLTITAIIIGLTDFQNISIINGIELTKYAFSYHLSTFGELSLLVILFLFSFSTIITVYYYGESSLKFLSKKSKNLKVLKICTLLSLFFGGLIKANIIWNFIDIFLGLLTIINMYAISKLKPVLVPKLKK